MLEHVFDPEIKTAPLSVKVNPGQIIIGETNFLDPLCVNGLEISPIQAALLVLVLTKAIEAEAQYSQELEKSCGNGLRDFGGFEG